uniref:protein-serine/threonine phosphatase n=1 Tax=Spongospora subterranea TaxID=70186 RepID=A0A0H5RAJ8_9EUKA|eukprot:CRZ10796.1 hypothetical protein [Spongospora subterranea]
MDSDASIPLYPPRYRRGHLTQWQVKIGDMVRQGQVIGKMSQDQVSQALVHDIHSQHSGTVQELKAGVGDIIDSQSVIAILSSCRHLSDYKGLCTSCGADVSIARDNSGQPRTTLKVFGKQSLNVTKEGLECLKKSLGDELRSRRKLLLVLDLDHTLVHATVDPRAKACVDDKNTVEFRLSGRPHYVKLRPGTHSFLTNLHNYFDIQVFTWGVREYAERIVNALDPDGQVIKGRITARDDLEMELVNRRTPPQKQLERLIPVCRSMALIVDDSAGVWRDFRSNLIEIRKFIYFPIGCEYAHGRAGTSSFGAPDEVHGFEPAVLQNHEQDNVLAGIERILIQVHEQYFRSQNNTADVRKLLTDIKKQVLHGCEIAFTGIIPLGLDLQLSREVVVAQELGAVVVPDITLHTTHLIARSSASSTKIKEAGSIISRRQTAHALRHIVHIDWLSACAAHFVHVDEQEFNLGKYKSGDVSKVSHLDPSSIRVPDSPVTPPNLSAPSVEQDRNSKKRFRSGDSSASAESEGSADYHESDFERELDDFLTNS